MTAAEPTVSWYGGGALNIVETVMDTVDVLANEAGVVSVAAITEYINRQGVAIRPGQVVRVLRLAVQREIMKQDAFNLFCWLDVE